jgi:hypothetical protein
MLYKKGWGRTSKGFTGRTVSLKLTDIGRKRNEEKEGDII